MVKVHRTPPGARSTPRNSCIFCNQMKHNILNGYIHILYILLINISHLIKIAKRSPTISKLQANILYSKNTRYRICSLDKIRMTYLLTPYSFVFFSFPFSFAHQMFSLSLLNICFVIWLYIMSGVFS